MMSADGEARSATPKRNTSLTPAPTTDSPAGERSREGKERRATIIEHLLYTERCGGC